LVSVLSKRGGDVADEIVVADGVWFGDVDTPSTTADCRAERRPPAAVEPQELVDERKVDRAEL
jgi:hypothetical protein